MVHHVDEWVLCRMVMNKIIKRYLLGAQSRVLVSWRAFVVAAQDGEIEHERHERVVLRCAKRMSQLTIARTFDRWAATATAQKEQRHRVRISLVRWQKRHLASCCASWIAFVDRRCLCRRVIAKVASRGNRCLLQGFSKWKDGVLRGAVERVTLQGAANALVVQWRSAVKGRLRAALGTWKRSVTHTTHAVHISTQRQRITVLARHHRSFVLGVVLSRRHFRVYHNVWNQWVAPIRSDLQQEVSKRRVDMERLLSIDGGRTAHLQRLEAAVAGHEKHLRGHRRSCDKVVDKERRRWYDQRKALVARCLADERLLVSCKEKILRGMERMKELRVLKEQLEEAWRMAAHWRGQCDHIETEKNAADFASLGVPRSMNTDTTTSGGGASRSSGSLAMVPHDGGDSRDGVGKEADGHEDGVRRRRSSQLSLEDAPSSPGGRGRGVERGPSGGLGDLRADLADLIEGRDRGSDVRGQPGSFFAQSPSSLTSIRRSMRRRLARSASPRRAIFSSPAAVTPFASTVASPFASPASFSPPSLPGKGSGKGSGGRSRVGSRSFDGRRRSRSFDGGGRRRPYQQVRMAVNSGCEAVCVCV